MTAFTETQLDVLTEERLQAENNEATAKRLKELGHPAFANWRPAAGVPDLGATATERLLPAAQAEVSGTTALDQQRAGVVEGMEGLGQEDYVVPRLKLKHDQTKDPDGIGISEIPNGEWYMSTDPGGHSPHKRVAFLDIRPQRRFALEGFNETLRQVQVEKLEVKYRLDIPAKDKLGVFCHSLDRVTPEPCVDRDGNEVHTGLNNGKCKGCPHAEWRRVGSSRQVDCGILYRCLVVDLDEGGPAWLEVNGSAVRGFKSALTTLQLKVRRSKLPIWAFGFTLGSTKKRNGNGDEFFVPTFGRPEPHNDDPQDYRDLRASLLGGAE